jgi:hypothetical protein
MSNTASAKIKAFMQSPTRLANGATIQNEDGGPAFLQSNIIDETTPTTGALTGVKVITKHTTNVPTRDIEVGEGERALVPTVTAWARPELREQVLVPGPIVGREGQALILNGLAKFKGGKDMTFGNPVAVYALSFDEITEIVNLTPHPVTLKREGMDDLAIESSGSARAEEIYSAEPVEFVDGVPVYDLSYTGRVVDEKTGEVINMPAVPGRIYIVSMITAQALLASGIKRSDVASPNFVKALGGAPSVTIHV